MFVSKKKYDELNDRLDIVSDDNITTHDKLRKAELRIEELEKEEYKLLDNISDAIYALMIARGEFSEVKSEEVKPGSSGTKADEHWSSRNGLGSDID